MNNTRECIAQAKQGNEATSLLMSVNKQEMLLCSKASGKRIASSPQCFVDVWIFFYVCYIGEIMSVAMREVSDGGGRCLEVEK